MSSPVSTAAAEDGSSDSKEKRSGKMPVKFVVLAMFFPLFLAFAYPSSFLTAFHAPVPHKMEIAVVADAGNPEAAQTAQEIVQGLTSQAEGAVVPTTVDSAEEAQDQVKNLDVRAAYDPATGNVYEATAGSVQATSMGAEPVLQQVAEQAGTGYNVVDLKAPEEKDSTGASFMYLLLGGMIGGFVTATMTTNLAGNIRWWKKLSVIGVVGGICAVLGTTIMWGFYGIYGGHILEAAAITFLMFTSVSVFQLGLNSLIGTGGVIPGMLLFIIFGIPASGMAIATDMLPGFYQMLHRILPTGAGGDMLRSVLYFDSNNIGTPLMTMLSWIIIGLAMLWVNSLRSSRTGPVTPTDDAHPSVRHRDPDDPLLVAYENEDTPETTSGNEPEKSTTGGAHRE
jgi:hypothetical protein